MRSPRSVGCSFSRQCWFSECLEFLNLPSKRSRWYLRSRWRSRKGFGEFVSSTSVTQSLHNPARNSALEGNSTLKIELVLSSDQWRKNLDAIRTLGKRFRLPALVPI